LLLAFNGTVKKKTTSKEFIEIEMFTFIRSIAWSLMKLHCTLFRLVIDYTGGV